MNGFKWATCCEPVVEKGRITYYLVKTDTLLRIKGEELCTTCQSQITFEELFK